MMKSLIITMLFHIPFLAWAQVEHNFEMKPEKTDCHEIPEVFSSLEEAIEVIESSKFRVQHSIKISRYQSPQSAKYYSCDGTTGYLVAVEDENLIRVYIQVPQEVWDRFIDSDDPVEFYSSEIKDVYSDIL